MSVHARAKWVLAIALVIAVALVLTLASSVYAAPTEPTLGIAALRAKLDASPNDALGRPHLDGYLKTVVQGSTITTIPLEVLGITDDNYIVFEASGPFIDYYGGIVEGMSGSPVFIDDGGNDELIGALSYGDYFTLHGTGLATPIEAMTTLENEYTPEMQELSHPILTDSGVIDRVVIAPDPADFAAAAQSGALVAKPLSTFQVGGVPAGSKVFTRFQSAMAAYGVSVVAQNPLTGSPALGDTSFETDLIGGASVAALMSRGDVLVGSIGTVTYSTTDTVLAYGHPANWDGATSMYMTNAWVDGIWPSLYSPYKLARPTAVRGEITEDRGSGIMGLIGGVPTETPITAHVTDTDTGESTSSAVYVPSKLLDTTVAYSQLVPMGVYPAASDLLDSYTAGGSAFTTTTVVVSDGTKTYTVVQPNAVDSSSYLADAITYDAWDAIQSLQAVLDYGVDQLHIVSVNLDADISLHRNNAQIVGVDVPGGIKTGVNHASISVLAYGMATTQTVEATFTVPAGISTIGMLSASSSHNSDEFYDYTGSDDSDSTSSRESVADIVDDLNTLQPNNIINLTYQPAPTADDEDMVSDTPITGPQPIETSATTTWSVSGQIQAGTPIIHVRRLQPVIGYHGSGAISGYIEGPDAVGKVSVYGHTAGIPGETFLGYADVLYSNDSPGPMFSFWTGALKANTTLRVHLDASDDGQWTSANVSTLIKVRARVGISASAKKFSAGKRITLTSVTLPKSTAGGTVTFQQWNASQKRWRSIGSAKLVTIGTTTKAAISWKPRRGTRKVRASYSGGSTNAGNASASITIVVK